MKKILLGAVLLFGTLSCTKDEVVKENLEQTIINHTSDGSVKEGYLGDIWEVSELTNVNDKIRLEPVIIGAHSQVHLIYAGGNSMYLSFSEWGSPEVGATFYTQGNYPVSKVEKGKIYFIYEHKQAKEFIKCMHVLDLSGSVEGNAGTKECYLGGEYGSKTRKGNHSTNVLMQYQKDYFTYIQKAN